MSYPTWLPWLGGTLLPLALLWGLWRLALRPERCYRYNRALLLLAPVVAAALPLLPRPVLPAWLAGASLPAAASPVAVLLPAAATQPGAAAGPWGGWSWLLALYAAGVAWGLGRLAWQVVRLRRLSRQLPRREYETYALVHTGGQLPTGTFGRVVFWDETTSLAPTEARAMLAHELAHVRQRHTLDALWLQGWRAVLWPNPFAHLLLPALRLTHELLADQEAASQPGGVALAAPYPVLLARLAARQVAAPLTYSLLHPFAFSSTLIRIAMLKTQVPVRRWKQWLVLPVLAAVALVAGHPASAQSAPAPPIPTTKELQQKVQEAMRQDLLRTGGKLEPGTRQQFNITKVEGPGEPVITITRVQTSEPAAPAGEKVYTYVEQMPALPGGGAVKAIMAAIQQRVVYPAGAPDGMVFANFTVQADGRVTDPRIIKGLADACDQAVLAAVRQLPRFEPGRQGGQAVPVSITVPVQFAAKP